MQQSKPIKQTDTVFLGDSLTESFDLVKHFGRDDLRNRGMSGNMTEHVLYRLEEIINTQPARVFLMIGINDIYQGVSLNEVTDHIYTIINRIISGSSQTKIFSQSILPVNETRLLAHQHLNNRIYQVNDQLQKFCKKNSLNFIDLYPEFLNNVGQMDTSFTYDGVHLTEQGYILWAELIQTYL